MRKFCRLLFTFLFLSIMPAAAFATLAVPIFDAAQNYSGPIVFFWNSSSNTISGATYVILVSTTNMGGQTFAQLAARTDVTAAKSVAASGNSNENQNATWLGGTTNVTYYFRMYADDGSGSGQLIAPNQQIVTCVVEKPIVVGITSNVNGVPSDTLNFDTSTITYTINLMGEYLDPILPPLKVNLDIQTGINPKTIFVTPPVVLGVNVNVSSSTFFARATYTWDGEVFVDKGNKHNGGYSVIATPVDQNGTANGNGTGYWDTFVNVVHINSPQLIYQTLGANQQTYGPPFAFNYFMSANSFVTWKIFKMNGQTNPNNFTLLKVVVSSVPKVCGDTDFSDPSGWNKMPNTESWDGRDSSGTIVPNDIYAYTFDGYDYSTDHAVAVSGTLSFLVLRIVDLASTGITNAVPLANIKYTLGGASSQAGGATVKIVICTPGTTFHMATAAGSMNYLNGASTYTYTVGDPIPLNASSLKKVFVFQRFAGAQSETWNGFDDTGVALPNANYVFAITALDDSGNRAVDSNLNNGPIIGNITIDRTAAQTSTVTAPPAVSGISAGGTAMALSGGVVLTQPFSTLAVSMTDAGGGTISLTGSQVTLTGPTTSTIPVTVSNNGTNTITLTFPQQSANGTYTVNIVPRDTVGNTAPATVYTFTLNISQTGVAAAFSSSMYAYPNPAKKAPSINFSYTTASASPMQLQVYTILGGLIYQENWTSQAGAQVKTWNIVNNANNRLATGVYLYRLSVNGTWAKFQKVLIIQ